MKIKKIKLYPFDELNEEQKAKAIEKNRDVEVGYGWEYPAVLWDWRDKLDGLGYIDADISYSGFYSQGDGASFTAVVDLEKWLKAHRKLTKFKVLASKFGEYETEIVRNDSHYVHENSVNANFSGYDLSDLQEEKLGELEGIVELEVRELSKQIYKDLRTEYEYLTSDDVVSDVLLTNEYHFNDQGEIVEVGEDE